VNLGPTTTGTEVYAVDEISVAADSGFRKADEHRVSCLLEDFKGLKYGTGNFCKPSVQESSTTEDKVISAVDGLVVLDNGKSTITALRRLKAALNAMSCLINCIVNTCIQKGLTRIRRARCRNCSQAR